VARGLARTAVRVHVPMTARRRASSLARVVMAPAMMVRAMMDPAQMAHAARAWMDRAVLRVRVAPVALAVRVARVAPSRPRPVVARRSRASRPSAEASRWQS